MVNKKNDAATSALVLWTNALPRPHKRLIMLAADAIFVALAFWGALLLKNDRLPEASEALPLMIVALLVSLPVFAQFGLYRAVVRYIGPRAFRAVFLAVTTATALVAVAVLAHLIPTTSPSVVVIA